METVAPIKMILARRAEIAEQRSKLDEEDAELEVAERVYRRLSGDASATVLPRPAASNTPQRGVKGQAAMIVAALEVGDVWQTSAEINSFIERTYGAALIMNSLNPQIWKLAKNNIVRRQGHKVALVSRLPEQRTPEVNV